MIVNPGKFQAIILDKKKTNHTQGTIKIENKAVMVKSSVKLLGVQIDAELNFNLRIANICRSAANQMFSHAKSLKKRALRFLYNNCNSPLEEIFKKSGKFCMEVNRLRYLRI